MVLSVPRLPRLPRRVSQIAAFAACILSVLSASAQEPEAELSQDPAPTGQELAPDENAETLLLRYEAPLTCPKASSFEERVEALTPAARFEERRENTRQRHLHIRIEQLGEESFKGDLTLRDESTSAERTFTDKSCTWVVDALALATALALDPNALGPVENAESKPQAPVEDPTEPEESPPPVSEPEKPARKSSVEVEVRVGADGFLLPNSADASESDGATKQSYLAFGGHVALEVLGRPLGALSSIEGQVSYAVSSSSELKLKWAPTGALGMCPVWWEPKGWLRVAPCLGASFGRLVSKAGDDIVLPFDKAVRPWISGDFQARFVFLLGGLRLGLEGGILVPFTKVSYLLSEEVTVLEIDNSPAPQVGLTMGWKL